MRKRKYILEEAGALLIVAALVISMAVATATTNNAVSIISEPAKVATGRAILWDQYDTDGSNGLSHSDPGSTGTRRDLLDDFEIPEGEAWILTDLHSLNLWDTMQPGVGTNFVLSFWTDNAGSPGAPIANAVTVSYTETATGRTWFSRPEFEIEYIYRPITLREGTYWICGHVVGPENCFWMARATIWGSECWCDYADQPPLQPGHNIFVDYYDLAFQLTGELEQPAVPNLSCDGSLSWEDVGPGATVTGEFYVGNVGDPGSILNWKIESYPGWGNWTFSSENGSLAEGDWETITVDVVAPPDENTEFTGTVKVINVDDPSDYCEISVYLKTPLNQNSMVLQILNNFMMQRLSIQLNKIQR